MIKKADIAYIVSDTDGIFNFFIDIYRKKILTMDKKEVKEFFNFTEEEWQELKDYNEGEIIASTMTNEFDFDKLDDILEYYTNVRWLIRHSIDDISNEFYFIAMGELL